MPYHVPPSEPAWLQPDYLDQQQSIPVVSGSEYTPGPWDAYPRSYLPMEDDPSKSATSKTRKLGKTCGECRRQHLRCDYSAREDAELSHAAHTHSEPRVVRCTRCEHRGMECVQVSQSTSRYYPRPSRTGRRIELGRQLHGSTIYPDSDDHDELLENSPTVSTQSELSWPRIYLRMINVFFSYTHAHFPVTVYERIAHAFNLSYGDFRLMAKYLNDGEADQGHPVMTGGSKYAYMRRGNADVEATPETMEVLMAVILAWAAHHVHLPFESLDPSIFTKMGTSSLVDAILADPELGYKRMAPSAPVQPTQESEGGPKRRIKRRQGVACDTCRLRRVRCDLMEQPPGSKACSRCRVKRIVCTDRYIQWKQQRDMQRRSAAGAQDANSLPVTVSSVQLLPELHEFEFDEYLSPSTLNLSQQELLEYGVVRENVCNILINRALRLIHKYKLQNTCNMQSVQCLILLAGLLDYSRPEMAYDAQHVAVAHLRNLFPAVHIDLSHIEDPSVAHDRLSDIFAARTQLTTWVRDAVFNVSYQRRPELRNDWFLLGYREPNAPKDSTERAHMRMFPIEELRKYMREDLPECEALVLVFCSSANVGKIAHRMYDELIQPLSKQDALPSYDEVCKVSTTVHSLWDDLYTVECLHRLLSTRARNGLRRLRAISIAHWTTMVYLLMFVLYQAISRRVRDWFVTSSSDLARGSVPETERARVLEAMRRLLQETQERALQICRTIAFLARAQLETGLLHRASSLTRLLFRVAQQIARTPAEEGSGSASEPPAGEAWSADERSVASVNSLLSDAPHAGLPESLAAAKAKVRDSVFDPELFNSVPFSRNLESFTRANKRSEIDWCIEGLGQIGYAFGGLETEIRRIVDIVQAMS